MFSFRSYVPSAAADAGRIGEDYAATAPPGGRAGGCFHFAYRVWALALVGLLQAAAVAQAANPLRCEDQLWLVSTRSLGCHAAEKADYPDYSIRRFVADKGWQDSDVGGLYDSMAGRLLVIYVHGNRFTASDAVREGWQVYHRLVAGRPVELPVTFVIWSWPSSPIRGLIKDARVKARRTNMEAYYLARLLATLPGQTQVGLIGHSFGARIVTGSLHLLGGGSIAGRSLDHVSVTCGKARVVLLAAAEHNYWLRPGAFHGRALLRVEQLLNLYNHCDLVLRHYRLLDRCGAPEALGATGMYTGDLDLTENRIRQFDVCCRIGKVHGAGYYFNHCWIRRQIQQAIYPQADVEHAASPDAAKLESAADGTTHRVS